MTGLSTFDVVQEAMYANPETLPDVPDDQRMIEDFRNLNISLKDFDIAKISPAVRSGFLQMWQARYVRELIQSQDNIGLMSLLARASWEMDNTSPTENVVQDLRLIHTTARNELAIRRSKEEQAG